MFDDWTLLDGFLGKGVYPAYTFRQAEHPAHADPRLLLVNSRRGTRRQIPTWDLNRLLALIHEGGCTMPHDNDGLCDLEIVLPADDSRAVENPASRSRPDVWP